MTVSYANPLWSIGVEEQFYLFWPLLVNYLKRKTFIITIIIMPILLVALNSISAHLYTHAKYFNSFFYYTAAILTITKLGCMAIGGIGAYFCFYHKKIIEKIAKNKIIEISCYFAILTLIIFKIRIKGFEFEVYSILFCYIILSTSMEKKPTAKI
ncbi:hypothetical protein [Hymenobacter busanensis]|nr:hypothetical protein [Hymenobacter busanensis]QHJ06775.1 hypothetical protein GUY19_05480 [Hymenobacter busanensis]